MWDPKLANFYKKGMSGGGGIPLYSIELWRWLLVQIALLAWFEELPSAKQLTHWRSNLNICLINSYQLIN